MATLSQIPKAGRIHTGSISLKAMKTVRVPNLSLKSQRPSMKATASTLTRISSPPLPFSTLDEPNTHRSESDQPSLYPEWLASRKDFQDLRNRYERLDSIDCFEVCQKSASIRNDFERKAVIEFIRSCHYFSTMKKDQLLELSERMHSVLFPSGSTLLSKGDRADCLYVLVTGRVGVYLDSSHCIDEVTERNVVGESAIQSRGKRSATIIAHGEVRALKLMYEDFDNVAFKMKIQDFYTVANFLRTMEYFSEWNLSKLYRLASVMIVKQYKSGQQIYTRGEPAHDLFIVRSGTVHLKVDIDVEKCNRWPVGRSQWAQMHTVNRYEKTLQECHSGDFFGERELIDNSTRSVGAFCDSQSALLYIIREEFFAEIFSDKDRKTLYQFSAQRPLTTQLRFQVEIESKQRHQSTEAMLNAINTNSVPIGRDLFLPRDDLKRVEWARRLVAQQKIGLKRSKPRQVKKFQTLWGRVSP